MNGFRAAFKHELRLLWATPGTWLFLVLGVAAFQLVAFFMGGLLYTSHLSMEPFFKYVPWVSLFLAPALAMGSWADEQRRNTLERLLTLPVSVFALLSAKFCTLLVLWCAMLACTFTLPATLLYLGSPDIGPIISGYLGVLLLGSAFLAVGMWCSTLSRTPAAAFTLALLALFVLLVLGWGVFAEWAAGFVPAAVLAFIADFSIIERFRLFSIGLIDMRNIAFFAVFTAFFIALAHINLLRLNTAFSRRMAAMGGWAVALVATTSTALLPLRVDTTAEQLYRLSPHSIAYLRELPQKFELEHYYSRNNPVIPSATRNYTAYAQDFLQELVKVNPVRITLKTIDPEHSVSAELNTLERGITEQRSGFGQGFYNGIVLRSAGREVVLPVLDNQRASLLEYDLIAAFHELLRTKRAHIGLLTELELQAQELRPRFLDELMYEYQVTMLGRDTPKIPDDIDVLVVFLTPFMGEISTYALDQYLVRGGRVVLLMDPFLRTAPSADYAVPDRNADATAMNHPADLLRRYGLEYDYRKVVADPQRAVPVRFGSRGIGLYPLWLMLERQDMNTELPFIANLQNLLLVEAGHLELERKLEGLSYTPFLHTSNSARFVPRDMLMADAPQIALQHVSGKPQRRALGYYVEGVFPSAFNELPQSVVDYIRDYGEFGQPPVTLADVTYQGTGTAQGRLTTLMDMDFMTDVYALEETLSGGRPALSVANDNLPLFYNMVQYFLGDDILLRIRAKGDSFRPVVRVQQMMQKASAALAEKEQTMTRELVQLGQELAALRQQRQNAQQADSELEKGILELRRKQLLLDKELKQLRRELRRDVTALINFLITLNTLVPVVLLSVIGGLFIRRRRKKSAACSQVSVLHG